MTAIAAPPRRIRVRAGDLLRRAVAALPPSQQQALEQVIDALEAGGRIVVDPTAEVALAQLASLLRSVTGRVPQQIERLLAIAASSREYDPECPPLAGLHRREAVMPTAALVEALMAWRQLAPAGDIARAVLGLEAEVANWSEASDRTPAGRLMARRLLACADALGYRPACPWPRSTGADRCLL